MRRFILLLLISLLSSCGGTTSKYKKVIADFVQTDSRGTKLDMNFKAEKLEEIRQVSIADSIKIITDDFNAEKNRQMALLEKTLGLFIVTLKRLRPPADHRK